MSTLYLVLVMLLLVTPSFGLASARYEPLLTLPQIVATQPQSPVTPILQPLAKAPLAHPRLFFDEAQLNIIRANAAGTHQAIWAPIRAYVEETRTELPPAQAPDAGLSTYRNFGNRLLTVAFVCVIGEEPAICELAKSHLRLFAQWQQWGEEGARDLGHAHMLFGNALAYDWLYPQLTEQERRTIGQSLAGWAEKLYEASTGPKVNEWYNWWRQSYAQNHHWINHSALGMAALALLGEEEHAPRWLAQASRELAQVQTLLNRINDGSWHEGIHYQNYGLTLLLPFLVNLRAITGQDLLPTAYLRNYMAWRLYNYVPGTWEPLLGYGDYERDWGDAYASSHLLRLLAGEFKNGQAQWLADQLVAVDGRSTNVWSTPWYVFEYFAYVPAVAPQPPDSLPLTRFFPDLEGVIWRTSWQADALVFGVKSGPYGGRYLFDTFTQQRAPWTPACVAVACELNFGHDHDDSNTFYLARAGQWLAPETPGVEKTATAFHNAILIDGQGQTRPPATYREPELLIGNESFVDTVLSSTQLAYLRADATQRYAQINGIEQVTRDLLLIQPNYFVIVDWLAAATAHRYSWVSHFGEAVNVEGKWVRGDTGDGQVLGVGAATTTAWQATTGDDGQPYVQIESRVPQKAMHFVHLLWPTTADAWSQRPDFTVLAEDANALVLRVTQQQAPQTVDEILLTAQHDHSQQVIGAYHYDGDFAVMRYDMRGNLLHLFVTGATALTDQSRARPLVTGLTRQTSFSAAFVGDRVLVKSDRQNVITLYAPEGARLLLNGAPRPFTRQGAYIIFTGS